MLVAPRLRQALLLTLFLAIARQAGAQEAADSTRLQEVVITASAAPVARSAAPATITVLEGDEIRARGITSLGEALRLVPGIAVARAGSFGASTSLFVRGGERDYVKVLVDGVPVNDPGGDVDLAHLTTDDIERIEIVRGPASVLYGSDAVSGVVQIITRRGAAGMTAEVGARGGSNGAAQADARIAGTRGIAAWSLSGAHRTSDGILPFNNADRGDAIGGSLTLASDEAGSIRFSARRTGGTFHFPTDGAGNVVDSSQFTTDRKTLLGMEAQRSLGKVGLRLLATGSDLHRTSANQPDSPGDTLGFYFRTAVHSTRRGADLRAALPLAGAVTVTVGGAVERERERSDGVSSFAGSPDDRTRFDQSRDTRAGYAEILATAGALEIAASGRVDDNSRFGTFTTGRASVVFSLDDNTTLRAAIGNAFKEPAFSEIFATEFSIGDPELDPERASSWEVGVDRSFDAARLTIGARYFDQRFKDMVQFRDVDRTVDQTTPNYANIAAARARGVELELSARPVRRLSLRANFTRLATRVTDAGFGAFGAFVDGEPLLRRPESSANLGVVASPGSDISVGSDVHYTGARKDLDFGTGQLVELSAYATVDVFANVPLRLPESLPELSATLRVDNLFAEQYSQVFGFGAPGRTILAGARVRLGH
jgi:vitamin B12 transporter